MYICVHCRQEKQHCSCKSFFSKPKTPHNLPGQRYDFWADYSVALPGLDVFDNVGNAMGMVSKAISQAFMLPRELFMRVNWDPSSSDEDIEVPPPFHTTQVVSRMRLPIYYWSCGHCMEEGEQEPLTVDHPFKMNCCHCGHEYTATQIINDLAYNTEYEWREV